MHRKKLSCLIIAFIVNSTDETANVFFLLLDVEVVQLIKVTHKLSGCGVRLVVAIAATAAAALLGPKATTITAHRRKS